MIELHERIAAQLGAIPTKKLGTDGGGTPEVTRTLSQMGKSLKYVVFTSAGAISDSSGWFFDVTWLHSVKKPFVNRAILAAKTEMGSNLAILDDFQKLAAARFDYRVMVFQQKNNDLVESVFGLLEEQVAAYTQTQPGDRYLLAGWAADEHRFLFKEFT